MNIKNRNILNFIQIGIIFSSIIILYYPLKSKVDVSLSKWQTSYDVQFDSSEKQWFISGEQLSEGWYDIIYGPYITLESGKYTLKIEYSSEEDQSFKLFAYDNNEYLSNINSDYLLNESNCYYCEFEVYKTIPNFEVVVNYNGKGDLCIKNITIHRYLSVADKNRIIMYLLIFDILFLFVTHQSVGYKLAYMEKRVWKKKDILFSITKYLSIVIIIFLALTLKWAVNNFGNISMEEIVFTLNMPLEGTANDTLNGYYTCVIIPVLIVACVIGVATYIPLRKRICLISKDDSKCILGIFPFYISRNSFGILISLSLSIECIIANGYFDVKTYLFNQFQSSSLIEKEYVDPSDTYLEFPQNKRNLIYIYLESGESSLQDVDNGGLFSVNYIPEMTELANDNISFSHSDNIEGAVVAPACGWTMSGMVAETSGLPLKLYKYDKDIDNSMDRYQSFLPGATSLGDILKDAGYSNYFMCGSDVTFGGRRSYLTQHGDYTLYDYYTALDDGIIPEGYYVWWGFEDSKLYDYAKIKLNEIASSGEPFNFTMLTVDTHANDGYICDQCENEYSERYGNVWRCASKQVYEFVEWIKQQSFYDNTTIVICGDHDSMTASFFGKYACNQYDGDINRKVYNAFINSAINCDYKMEKNRKFTTLDMFPTVLASLGVKIDGDRLGLGTNLFSGMDTLAEKYGYTVLFDELGKKSPYYNKKILYIK